MSNTIIGAFPAVATRTGCRLHKSETRLREFRDVDYESFVAHLSSFPDTSLPYYEQPQAGERSIYSTRFGYTFPGDEALLQRGIGFDNEGGEEDSLEPKTKKKQRKQRGHFQNGKFVRDDATRADRSGILKRGWTMATGGQKVSKVMARCKHALGALCFIFVAKMDDTPAAFAVAWLLILIGIVLLFASEKWVEKAIDEATEGVKGLRRKVGKQEE